ncbi:uncharacterized protein UV8b_07157 [Ustilaginoidea virens]|uniref:Uncharacterized protein n=1 Tax=Ustilaginoidea virens TaxID=1159556 RepID=A0A063BU44_USTVR|nr:uncharacterized protein UV8b_07157 [Ustilaginoidea virens]QUC22916.1 hypothetical protein UV8b_07157 [Ustilaginoidea virens]GAO17585.1 hypothetical protein UVI_02047260 [Ustilaginoidea virens]
MPYRLDTHVLTVDANVIHKVDTANPANLHDMWTVFSRCADSVEQGRRLENLSWRIWQREQLVESKKTAAFGPFNPTTSTTIPTTAAAAVATATLPRNVPCQSRLQELPQLSGSVDSLADDETVEITSVSAPLEIRPRIHRLDSSTSRRDRHISSDDYEKMVSSIVNDKAPLSAPSQTSPLMPAPRKQHRQQQQQHHQQHHHHQPTASMPPPAFERSGSTTTESQTSEAPSEESNCSPIPPPAAAVARARRAPTFPEPTCAASSDDALPAPSSSPAAKHVHPRKQPARFALGGSCSSSERSRSMEHLEVAVASGKKPLFQIGDSSGEDSLQSGPRSAMLPPPHPHKTHSSNPLGLIPQPPLPHHGGGGGGGGESAVDSDTEAEYVDESAIDDGDEDWEDSVEDSGRSSVDDKFFQRVESKARLATRPSLITLMLAQNDRAKTLGNTASQSTPAIHRSRTTPGGPCLGGGSPNDSDEAPLMMKGMRHSALKPISEIPRSSAQPIVSTATHVPYQAALSPRTTRRNMLATELTESLRRHLLWERQQKTLTVKAALKRRHTSHDVANLKQYPDKVCMKPSEDVEARSWNQYFSKEALNGYHSKGW